MTRVLLLLVTLLLLPVLLHAQISPGDLTRAHASLDGVQNCTKCHTIGKTISNDRCFVCHTEIAARIKAREGYHATVIDKQCASCHSEHHGRDFSIIHFDKSKFDHNSTGYPLVGKHAAVACEKCHTPKNVTAADVRTLLPKRSSTYLGLGRACKSCHADQHAGQFTATCDQCHTEAGWKPAPKFSHDRSRYPLTGKHVNVECAACHNKKVPGTNAVTYRGLAFSKCSDCHGDPHHGKFTQACSACHTTGGWQQVSGREFDHSRTKFPLRGAHAKVACKGCHAQNPKSTNVSGELGFHITRFQACANCHPDSHGGQFADRPDKGRCESCHSDVSFTLVTYSVEDHAKSRYPLTGAHKATPCIACHIANVVRAKSTRQFRWAGAITCAKCHKDNHGGQFNSRSGGCEACHTTKAWADLLFDHAKTKFPLEGKHKSVDCSKCHVKATPVRYVGVTTVCADCHEEPHAGQFAKNGKTACEPCHSAVSWKSLTFDHAKTRFPLTGKHASVACAQCHKTETIAGKSVVRYKPLGIKCEDCHGSSAVGKARL